MKNAIMTPLTMDEFMDIGMDPNEIETVEHAGVTVSRFEHHYDYGNVILIGGNEQGGLMIQADTVAPDTGHISAEKITYEQLVDIVFESGDSVERSSHGIMDIHTVCHPEMDKLTLVSNSHDDVGLIFCQ